MDILRIVLSILLPPLAVFLTIGLGCISGSILSLLFLEVFQV